MIDAAEKPLSQPTPASKTSEVKVGENWDKYNDDQKIAALPSMKLKTRGDM